jgi:hypothetical protein
MPNPLELGGKIKKEIGFGEEMKNVAKNGKKWKEMEGNLENMGSGRSGKTLEDRRAERRVGG